MTYYDSDGKPRPSYWNSADEALHGDITNAEMQKGANKFSEMLRKRASRKREEHIRAIKARQKSKSNN